MPALVDPTKRAIAVSVSIPSELVTRLDDLNPGVKGARSAHIVRAIEMYLAHVEMPDHA
jgi:predicted transcriptional regulator